MGTPAIKDFTSVEPPKDDLDAYCAWQNFGGHTVEEAYERFCSDPDTYQEDFMFMGDPAFVYYFPVVERYLREEEPKHEFDAVAWVLAHCIAFHVSPEQNCVRPLYDRIQSLTDFVLDSLGDVADHPDRGWSPQEIEDAWSELRRKLATAMERIPSKASSRRPNGHG